MNITDRLLLTYGSTSCRRLVLSLLLTVVLLNLLFKNTVDPDQLASDKTI